MATYFTHFTCGNVHVSMLLSQFIPPSPTPTVSTGLFSMSASHFLKVAMTDLFLALCQEVPDSIEKPRKSGRPYPHRGREACTGVLELACIFCKSQLLTPWESKLGRDAGIYTTEISKHYK